MILVPRALAACNPIGRRSNYAFDRHADDRQAPCSLLISHTHLFNFPHTALKSLILHFVMRGFYISLVILLPRLVQGQFPIYAVIDGRDIATDTAPSNLLSQLASQQVTTPRILTMAPSNLPSQLPSQQPTTLPSVAPSNLPSQLPSTSPTTFPSFAPPPPDYPVQPVMTNYVCGPEVSGFILQQPTTLPIHDKLVWKGLSLRVVPHVGVLTSNSQLEMI